MAFCTVDDFLLSLFFSSVAVGFVFVLMRARTPIWFAPREYRRTERYFKRNHKFLFGFFVERVVRHTNGQFINTAGRCDMSKLGEDFVSFWSPSLARCPGERTLRRWGEKKKWCLICERYGCLFTFYFGMDIFFFFPRVADFRAFLHCVLLPWCMAYVRDNRWIGDGATGDAVIVWLFLYLGLMGLMYVQSIRIDEYARQSGDDRQSLRRTNRI